MKKILKGVILAIMFSLGLDSVQAQIIVNIRPNRPVRRFVRRPPSPFPGAIWVDEDWSPNGNRYVWKGGYWSRPPHRGAFYIPGHWNRRGRGNIWIAGHWRLKRQREYLGNKTLEIEY